MAVINSLTGNAGTFGGYENDPQAPGGFSYGLSDYQASPGYQWQQDQARKGIEAGAAARGYLNSGAAMKAISDRAQQIALQDFRNERQFAYGLNRDQRADYQDDRNYLTGRYDRGTDDLFRYTGMGANSLNATGNAYLGVGQAGADAALGTGNANSGAALQQGNIYGQMIGNLAGTAAGYLGGLGGGAAKSNGGDLYSQFGTYT